MAKDQWSNFEIEFYKEAGHMFRHFSTIRVAVLTAGFGSFITMSAYILINTNDRESLILWSVVACVLYLSIMLMAAIFTIKASQSKSYMQKFEDRAYKMKDVEVSGPFNEIAAQFNPVGNIFDAVTVLFLSLSIIPISAFLYKISSI